VKVLGLDISTYVGMALVGEGEDRGKCIHFAGLKGFKRLAAIKSQLEMVLDVWAPDYAVIEGFGFKNKFTLVTLVEVGTIVRDVLHRRGIPWYEVPPTTLKMWTTGKGNAKKPDMAAAAKKRWGYESPSDDIVDAFSLGKMGEGGLQSLLAVKGVLLGI
jgi:Holliday junction resolvasome RuvABC endonuclease subunit